MARHMGSVLIDTNSIIECHRAKLWRALAGAYRLETVEKCIEETQTGFQRRRPEQQIDQKTLEAALKAVHKAEPAAFLAAAMRDDLFGSLHDGEQHLWAHALTRKDLWLLCGPDRASLRFGIRLNLRDRMVSLEKLLKDAGAKPKGLRANYTTKWLDQVLAELAMEERKRK
jgi:hypothetical protein